jgi:drug/metabolite transporter (DMT)-like permease
VIFGLVAALGWGLADFFGAVAGRRIGAFATVIIGQLLSAAFITVLMLASGRSASPLRDVAAFVAANGIATAIAYATHYRALELGPVAVVSPIGASYAVVGVVLAVIVLGERPDPLAYVGVVVTVVGSVLVSTDVPAALAGARQPAPGLPLAIIAAIGFGVAAFLLAYVVRHSDWIVGLWASRLAQVTCYLPLAVARRAQLGRLRVAAAAGIAVALLAGAADILGVTAYSVGAERGFVTIVLGASAIFPLIPVVLSHVVLKEERLAANQYAGILFVMGGLLLLGLASA